MPWSRVLCPLPDVANPPNAWLASQAILWPGQLFSAELIAIKSFIDLTPPNEYYPGPGTLSRPPLALEALCPVPILSTVKSYEEHIPEGRSAFNVSYRSILAGTWHIGPSLAHSLYKNVVNNLPGYFRRLESERKCITSD